MCYLHQSNKCSGYTHGWKKFSESIPCVFLATENSIHYLELLGLRLEGVDGDNLLKSVQADEDEGVLKFRDRSLMRCHLVDKKSIKGQRLLVHDVLHGAAAVPGVTSGMASAPTTAAYSSRNWPVLS